MTMKIDNKLFLYLFCHKFIAGFYRRFLSPVFIADLSPIVGDKTSDNIVLSGSKDWMHREDRGV